jgi:hypothetical protein
MDSSFVTAGAAALGSLVGATASIVTTWITQRTETVRTQTEGKRRERAELYAEFAMEASRLTAEALSHSLDQPGTLAKLYGILARIRLVAADPVLAAAEACSRQIINLYSGPNMTVEQIRDAFERDHLDPLKDFSTAARTELLEMDASG